MDSEHKSRALTPVVATILVVAIMIIISVSIGAVTLGFGDRLNSPAPSVAFDTEEETNLVLHHTGGETLDRDKIEIRGGTLLSAPETIQAGNTIEVDADEEEVTVVWDNGRSSAVLTTVHVTSSTLLGLDLPAAYLNGNCVDVSGPDSYAGKCAYIPAGTTESENIDTGPTHLVVEETATYSGNINSLGTPGDVFLKENAAITNAINSDDGNISLQDGATIDATINSNAGDIYLFGTSQITSAATINPSDFDTIYLNEDSQIDPALTQDISNYDVVRL